MAALPLGIVRLVEVGRALASDPQVLLLDEPLSGLDMKASENLLAVFRQIVDQADHPLSLIIVEHDVAAVLALSDTSSCSTSVSASPWAARRRSATTRQCGPPTSATASHRDVRPSGRSGQAGDAEAAGTPDR